MRRNIEFASSPRVALDTLPAPRRVSFDAPWRWLAAGWSDIRTAPHVSLSYGCLFALAALVLALLLSGAGAHALFLPLAGGALLIGPLLAVGLYDASRRLQHDEPVELAEVAMAPLGARGQLGFFSALLLFACLAWMQLAFLLLMLFLGSAAPPPASAFIKTLLFTPHGLGLLIVGTLAGALFAALVFAISVVGVPILLVSQTDAVSAARASIAAVRQNPKPMALWAGLIVLIMALGLATLLIGLVVAFPLIGHATWHAYADIYGDRTGS